MIIPLMIKAVIIVRVKNQILMLVASKVNNKMKR